MGKGKVVIDAFRTISTQSIMLGLEPRQTTSNLGHLQKPSIQALIHGLNRNYYSMPIVYKKYIDDESKLTKEELEIRNYGKIDPKRHLEEQSEVLNGENIVQCLSAML